MKTLIFSIYISRCSIYQWEVRMFLNSLLTWSLGQATHKCCLVGVEIGHRGPLQAVRSWPGTPPVTGTLLQAHSPATVQASAASLPLLPTSVLGSSHLCSASSQLCTPSPSGEPYTHVPWSQPCHCGRARVPINHISSCWAKSWFNLIYVACKK